MILFAIKSLLCYESSINTFQGVRRQLPGEARRRGGGAAGADRGAREDAGGPGQGEATAGAGLQPPPAEDGPRGAGWQSFRPFLGCFLPYKNRNGTTVVKTAEKQPELPKIRTGFWDSFRAIYWAIFGAIFCSIK